MEKRLDNIPPLKGLFPFSLCATSFIIPGHMHENVRLLSPIFDEIELLFFESEPFDRRPNVSDIKKIKSSGEKQNTRFNVHLPIDIDLGAKNPEEGRRAILSILRISDLTSSLNPESFTLHIPAPADDRSQWIKRLGRRFYRLSEYGMDCSRICIETLDYPIDLLIPVIEEANLGVCLDLGHLFIHGFDPVRTFEKVAPRTLIIHLHGTKGQKDHLGLDSLLPDQSAMVFEILKDFKKSVSLEVFSQKKLESSAKILRKWFDL